MKTNTTEKTKAIEELKKLVKPGDTLYTILRHVSSSGMSRAISTYAIVDGKPWLLDWYVSKILDRKLDDKHEGVKVGGCGMDMGFHLVYSLSNALYRDGVMCTGEGCNSNDHVNGDRDYTPHPHNDGGYALNQKWL